METTLKELMALIDNARQLFAQRLQAAAVIGPTSLEQYVRYLSFQYHLTRGVQRYFITAAAHPDLAKRKKLRAFLVNFANEEELHYLVAANDLRKLGQDPLPEPFDVTLLHAYFRSASQSGHSSGFWPPASLRTFPRGLLTSRCSEHYRPPF